MCWHAPALAPVIPSISVGESTTSEGRLHHGCRQPRGDGDPALHVHRHRRNATSGSAGYGIYCSGCTNTLIEGNDIYENVGGGIQMYPGGTGTGSGNVIRHNK